MFKKRYSGIPRLNCLFPALLKLVLPYFKYYIEFTMSFFYYQYVNRRYSMIANETTLHKRPNNTEINNYWSLKNLNNVYELDNNIGNVLKVCMTCVFINYTFPIYFNVPVHFKHYFNCIIMLVNLDLQF